MTNLTSTNDAKLTKALLTCGISAGPLYIIAGLIQMAIRPGFDITRHSLSLLANGDLGWIQILNFLLTGLLLIAGAVGVKRALQSGPGSKWAPLMLGLYGLGLMGAGIFSADPALGFSPGTPLENNPISWHGLLISSWVQLASPGSLPPALSLPVDLSLSRILAGHGTR